MAIYSTPSPLSNILAAKTYNAAWFPGTSNEAKIQAAINAVLLDIAPSTTNLAWVFVPASMLPYQANLVTFSNKVKMVGEGTNPGSWDLRSYGYGLGGASDAAARAAIAAADLGNIALGSDALIAITTGTNNTAVGEQALTALTTGSKNSAFGYKALLSEVSGTGNVAVGHYAGAYETGSNAFYVDNQDRTNTAGDKAKALMYGVFAATAASQTLQINALVTVTQGYIALNNASGGYVHFINSAGVLGNDIGMLGGAADAGLYIWGRDNAPMTFAVNNNIRMTLAATGVLTLTNNIAIVNTGSDLRMIVDADATHSPLLSFRNAGVEKWLVGRGVSSASNDLVIYDAVSAFDALRITTNTRIVTINAGLVVSTGTTAVQVFSATTGAFSGTVTLNNAGTPTVSQALIFSGSTTAAVFHQMANTGNATYIGIESSAGGALITGTTAYSTILSTASARSLHLCTNNAVRLTVDSTGLATFAGNVTLTAGNFSIGQPIATNLGIYHDQFLSGAATQRGLDIRAGGSSAATSEITAGYFFTKTVAAVYTCGLMYGVFVESASKGAGSTITTLFGVYVASQTVGATNYAIYTNTGAISFGDAVTIRVGGLTHASTTLLTTSVALTNGAGASAGTLGNAPAAGNPTKWIPINDNGTTRYIPAW